MEHAILQVFARTSYVSSTIAKIQEEENLSLNLKGVP
jgi:hypothetical protein